MQKSQENNLVPWKFEASPEIRDAIVRAFVPHMAEGSDSRYITEYENIISPPYTTALSDRQLLIETLKNNDVIVSKVENAGEFHGQGGGNYSVFTLEQIEDYYTSTLWISDLGRFVARDMVWYQQDHSYNMIDDELGAASKNRLLLCQKIVTQIGFNWPEEKLLKTTVPELNVYYFGRREPLPVCDLLYYWQD